MTVQNDADALPKYMFIRGHSTYEASEARTPSQGDVTLMFEIETDFTSLQFQMFVVGGYDLVCSK